MEPERKIEKWLKAYAKKRRTQAGEPFKLHPATRQLLQGEIARDKPKADDDDESVSLWEVIRQQWAILLSFAVCIFLVGVILLPVVHYARKSQTFASASGAREMAPNANAPAVEGNRTPSTSLDEKKDLSLARNELNGEENKGDLQEEERKASVNSETSYATNSAPPPSVAMTVTPTAAPEVSHSIAATPLEISPGSSAIPPVPAGGTYDMRQTANVPMITNDLNGLNAGTQTTPPLVPPVEMQAMEQNAGTFSGQLKSGSELGPVASRRSEKMQTVFKNSIEPSQAGSILSNFQVQQNGDAIRLVDQDGSVYNGWLQLANQTVEKIQDQSALNADTRLAQNSITVIAGLPGQQIAAAQDALQLAQNYFFHVYGTNRTMKQTVSFTGNLTENFAPTNNEKLTFGLTDNSANAGGGGGFGGFGGGGGAGGEVGVGDRLDRVKLERTNRVAQLPWENLRITGTAVVNQTNRVRVNAAPVAPGKN